MKGMTFARLTGVVMGGAFVLGGPLLVGIALAKILDGKGGGPDHGWD